MTFKDHLSKSTSKDVAIISPTCSYTRIELITAASSLAPKLNLKKDFLVDGNEVATAVIQMLALDGKSPVILFKPNNFSEELSEKFQKVSKKITNQPYQFTNWIMATSGTTGIPKLINHSFSSLIRSTKLNAVKGGSLRWALMYEPCSFAGLQVLLQALLGGSCLLTAPIGNLEKYVKFLVSNKCNAISATPSMWRKLLLLTDLKNLKLKFISLGGEIADSNILKTLSNNFPQARITHIYASTEVGVAFSVKDGKAGFPASYLNKVPNRNIKLKVKQGKLFFKELSESNHISSFDTLTKDNDSFVDTGDIVSVEGNRVYFLGRQNGSINVGGNKVMPNEIESVIRELPEILDAHAYGKPNPILGTVIVVDVVSNNSGDFDILKKLIHAYCREKLTSFKRPAIIKLVDSSTLTSNGKIKRKNK